MARDTSPNSSNLRAYDAEVKDGILTIVVRKEFDFGTLHQGWAANLVRWYPGPFRQVVIDLSHCGLVSSTFLAGLLVLNANYVKGPAAEPIRIVNPDARVVRNLKIMHMAGLFHIVAREQMLLRTPRPE